MVTDSHLSFTYSSVHLTQDIENYIVERSLVVYVMRFIHDGMFLFLIHCGKAPLVYRKRSKRKIGCLPT